MPGRRDAVGPPRDPQASRDHGREARRRDDRIVSASQDAKRVSRPGTEPTERRLRKGRARAPTLVGGPEERERLAYQPAPARDASRCRTSPRAGGSAALVPAPRRHRPAATCHIPSAIVPPPRALLFAAAGRLPGAGGPAHQGRKDFPGCRGNVWAAPADALLGQGLPGIAGRTRRRGATSRPSPTTGRSAAGAGSTSGKRARGCPRAEPARRWCAVAKVG